MSNGRGWGIVDADSGQPDMVNAMTDALWLSAVRLLGLLLAFWIQKEVTSPGWTYKQLHGLMNRIMDSRRERHARHGRHEKVG